VSLAMGTFALGISEFLMMGILGKIAGYRAQNEACKVGDGGVG